MAKRIKDTTIEQLDDGYHWVRYWSVYQQRWIETEALGVPDRELAAMGDDLERSAIITAQEQDRTRKYADHDW